MENLTELLKESANIKKEKGNLAAIDFLKSLMINKNLREADAVKCIKKINSFVKNEKTISSQEALDFFLKVINERIQNHENKYELFYTLAEFFSEKKEYDLAFKMTNGAVSSISPTEFLYFHKLRNCYNKMADICRVSILNERDKSLEYLFRITAACIFEIVGELNRNQLDNLKQYAEDDFSQNYYLNDEDGNFDTAIKAIGLFEKKKEILNSIHKFVTVDIPKQMELVHDLENSGKTSLKNFNDAGAILDFSRNLY